MLRANGSIPIFGCCADGSALDKALNKTLPGWDRKETRKPAAFLMCTKFAGIIACALGISQVDFLRPFGRPS